MIRLIAAAVWLATAAVAVEPSERLADPALEDRAREVSKALRWVVCQNESIDDSNAELAKDMRLLVRDRIKAGDSNQAVLDYMVERYGEFVLLKPRFLPMTVALWAAPVVILALGGFAAARALNRRPAATPAPLDDAEKRELAKLTRGSVP
jgi:cytochrome c-type biogenesis protein CcmH